MNSAATGHTAATAATGLKIPSCPPFQQKYNAPATCTVPIAISTFPATANRRCFIPGQNARIRDKLSIRKLP